MYQSCVPKSTGFSAVSQGNVARSKEASYGVVAGGLQHPILAIELLRDWGRGRLPSEGKGHTFESCRVRQFFLILQRDMSARTETPTLPRLSE